MISTIKEDGYVSRRERVCALLLLVIFFAFGLFDHSLWSANDSREGAMIAEMLRTNIWVTPIFNGVPYLEKPPLMHWVGVVLCKLTGVVNEGMVRLPAALFGFGALMVIYIWAKKMGRERAGLFAAFMCATSVQYFEYSKVVLTDTTITFMVVFALFLFRKAYDAVEHKKMLYAGFLLISALSFYAKGLLAPGCIWVGVCAFLLYKRNWKLFFVLPFLFLFTFVAVLIPWVVMLWDSGGFDMIKGVFWDNQFGRFLEFSDAELPADPFFVHKEPITYYLFRLPLRLMPWSLLALPAMVFWFRRGKGLSDTSSVLLRFALCAILLILHVSTAKATAYALPLYPIIFLMIGVWLDEAIKEPLSRTHKWLLGLTFGALALALLLPSPVFAIAYLLGFDVIRNAGSLSAFLCFALAILTAGVTFYAAWWVKKELQKRRLSKLSLPVFIIISGLFVANAAFVYPIYDNQRTYVPFVDLVRDEIEQGRHIVLASPHERDCGQFMFYLDQPMEVVSIKKGLHNAFCRTDMPVGVIVPENDLRRIVRYLSIVCDDREDPVPGPYERPFKMLRSDHSGYKARGFVLILND